MVRRNKTCNLIHDRSPATSKQLLHGTYSTVLSLRRQVAPLGVEGLIDIKGQGSKANDDVMSLILMFANVFFFFCLFSPFFTTLFLGFIAISSRLVFCKRLVCSFLLGSASSLQNYNCVLYSSPTPTTESIVARLGMINDSTGIWHLVSCWLSESWVVHK